VTRAKLGRLTAEREAALKAVIESHERVSDNDAEQTRVRDDYSRALHRLEKFQGARPAGARIIIGVCRKLSRRYESEDFHLIGTLADSIQVVRAGRARSKVFSDQHCNQSWCRHRTTRSRAAWLKHNQPGARRFWLPAFTAVATKLMWT